ncbi:hypothetical protein JCM4814A_75990 [Streptomyces phaeofaciens JCM 4814]|uniref:Uncharacterized protein n=1 Tax=Streptomyces phaeofaciens TaxID=68254 RepID=A0A918LXK1_9ACTN|nr:hypothetical protein [Streptomyces phaeofaciens]GGT64906.1 hypothetical protein GCM10010226_48430 [Streptomyces phaeofaciens]
MGEELQPRSHKDKVIRDALVAIMANGGWKLHKGAHWGLLTCDAGCHRISVSGTPRVSERHARDLLREARTCPLPDDDPRSVKRTDV